MKARPIIERFWEKVDKSGKCWLWTGTKNGKGYGGIRADKNGKMIRVHRFSFMIHFGEIPSGMLVCHKCDNPLCVNPDHLFLGTQSDNLIDMYVKNRHPLPQGKQNPKVRLNEHAVIEIRNLVLLDSIKLSQIAKRFDVSRGCVASIVKRRSWAWLRNEP